MRGRPQSIPEEAILDAARDVFRAEGHATTTAAIARQAGVSEGILFYRFKTKEALLAAVIIRETEPPERLRELVRESGRRSLLANLEILVETAVDCALRIVPFIELALTKFDSAAINALFSAPGVPPPERAVVLVAAYLDAEIRLGRIRRLDPAPIARAILGGSMDFARSRQFSRAEGDRATFISGLVDFLLHGLAAPAHPES